MNEETDRKLQELQADLKTLADKYGINNGAIIGEMDGKFLGMALKNYKKPAELFELAANAGRWWQHVRCSVKKTLDDFEKGWT